MISNQLYIDKLIEHYSSFWGMKNRIIPFNKGPVGDLPPEFAVIQFEPSSRHDFWIYATLGMSLRKNDADIELFICSPEKDNSLVELLYIISHYHQTGESLNTYHTINFGRPWLEDSTCEYGLISPPYIEDSHFSRFSFDDHGITILWLIPITEKERDYKINYGVDALEALFESTHFNYLDPMRTSFIKN